MQGGVTPLTSLQNYLPKVTTVCQENTIIGDLSDFYLGHRALRQLLNGFLI